MKVNKFLFEDLLRRAELDMQEAFRLIAEDPDYPKESGKLAEAVEMVRDVREDVCQS
jgi:hypothetical protein